MKLLVITLLILKSSAGPSLVTSGGKCLTGVITDAQSWVADNGTLTTAVESAEAIDVSSMQNPVVMLELAIVSFRTDSRIVRYLSLANCRLTSVPPVFELKDSRDRSLSTTLAYLSLYGNNFRENTLEASYDTNMNATNAVEMMSSLEAGQYRKYGESQWSFGLRNVNFTKLKELDLRASNIVCLTDNLFQGMPNLEALYLSDNKITHVSSNAFNGLHNLLHIDLSRNNMDTKSLTDPKMLFENALVLKPLSKLRSLDLSYTKLSSASRKVFRHLGPAFERLSLCHTSLSKLPNFTFRGTSLRFLDVSNNPDILYYGDALKGTEDTLTVVYADRVSLHTARVFENFHQLEILKITNNDLTFLTPKEARSWKKLKVLYLDSNKISPWFQQTFSLIRELKVLSLRKNNINIISSIMMSDIQNVEYLAVSGNYYVCNCYLRELYEIAYENEVTATLANRTDIEWTPGPSEHMFHTAYADIAAEIAHRNKVNCSRKQGNSTACRYREVELQHSGQYLLLDYSESQYRCLSAQQTEFEAFRDTDTCQPIPRDNVYADVMLTSWNQLYLIFLIPLLLIPALFIGLFYKRIRYFCITVKNSAMLSLISDSHSQEEGAIYNYDVFVSYCNEDRWWVLDHLLAHVERDCNVRMCLHERDFQVGLSILENIVSCMDRSKSIMLIISHKFLRSQWCQFEMHLAQHRLLETRREDLILILLEDIPRRLRPNTLHYLMLTKTYIVWPSDPPEQTTFWKRIRKCLVTHTIKQSENVSLA